ncbi:patatin-like protein 3 [Dorcoceras hygrometricum]|uniref:Patatin-like protein 3 n=1 Tax=Dorcoceras hygrometricum TaxID=472368 RepID=A0A2Z6ZZD4_9LAMI|nr:patatin-like protein 3 [Dorcoceras hygrometricum]
MYKRSAAETRHSSAVFVEISGWDSLEEFSSRRKDSSDATEVSPEKLLSTSVSSYGETSIGEYDSEDSAFS